MRYTMLVIGCLALVGCKKALDTKPSASEGPKNTPYTAPQGGTQTGQAVRGAVNRPQVGNDLKNLQIFIENASGAAGQMPDKATIITSLKQTPDAKNLVKLIEEGWIVLTGIKQREGIWAYEKEATERGGMVLSNNGVERLDQVELQNKLKMQ